MAIYGELSLLNRTAQQRVENYMNSPDRTAARGEPPAGPPGPGELQGFWLDLNAEFWDDCKCLWAVLFLSKKNCLKTGF